MTIWAEIDGKMVECYDGIEEYAEEHMDDDFGEIVGTINPTLEIEEDE
jgi:hypothetical protein